MGVWIRHDGSEVLTDPETGDIIDETPATPTACRAARNIAMMEAWRAGESLTEIAQRAGLSLSWTGRLLRQLGAELPDQRQGVKRKDLDEAAIIREYQDGASMLALADRHHATYWSVRRLLQKRGVQIRSHCGQNVRKRTR
ncbi:hypothetical protein ATK36_3164 [Amycolatopsis sulphurea]|uniref:Helix-turn-helix domain-containing protein n=1 Tax=Amycolatopsis sulphurea TaxID=76022 RepID=A0A2A9FC65_9PSEU|nr:hypothetical protein [Amycolatopsis sulphurea]PFG48090.1 hypothetical protein ATK36_3164 [Amycolatopsis sulphurea]